MRAFLISFFVFITLFACSQNVPETLPAIENPKFSDRLESLLSFNVPVIGVEELAESLDKYTVLDAREKKEYDVSHLPTSTYLGYKDFNKELLEGLDKSKPIVLYCSVGYRSDKMGKKLKNLGFQEVYNLYGSIFEWANTGHELMDAQNESTKKVHTYNEKWSQWLDEGEGLEKVW